MEKITKRRFDLVGKTIYRERSDCSYWKLVQWNENSSCYGAVKLNDELKATSQSGFLTPSDMVGDYMF